MKRRGNTVDRVWRALIGDDQRDADFPGDACVAIGGTDAAGFVTTADDAKSVAIQCIEQIGMRCAGHGEHRANAVARQRAANNRATGDDLAHTLRQPKRRKTNASNHNGPISKKTRS